MTDEIDENSAGSETGFYLQLWTYGIYIGYNTKAGLAAGVLNQVSGIIAAYNSVGFTFSFSNGGNWSHNIGQGFATITGQPLPVSGGAFYNFIDKSLTAQFGIALGADFAEAGIYIQRPLAELLAQGLPVVTVENHGWFYSGWDSVSGEPRYSPRYSSGINNNGTSWGLDAPSEHIHPADRARVIGKSSDPAEASARAFPEIQFAPDQPLTPIYHTPIAPPPPRLSGSASGSSSHSPASQRGNEGRGDYSGSGSQSGSSKTTGGSSSGSAGTSASSKSSSSSAGSGTARRDNQDTKSYGSWGGTSSGSKTSNSGWGSANSPGDTAKGNGYGGSSNKGSTSTTGKTAWSPVLLDIDGSGLSVEPLASSTSFFDLKGNGYLHRMASPGAGTGMLVKR